MPTRVICPECGEDISEGPRRAYKHAIACFHLEDKGPDQIIREVEGRHDLYAERVKRIMTLAKGEE